IRQYQQQEAEQQFEPSPSLRDEAATRAEKNSNLKKQNQNRPSAGNSKYEYLNPKQVERVSLKKQSQFDALFSPEFLGKIEEPPASAAG
ncbi:MAG: hypothetical protein ACYSTT_24195, partial [Planctomycetota bacterium]